METILSEIGWRPLAAFLAGLLMSLSGSSIQAVTQNELAGPSTLGLNAFCVVIILISHFIMLAIGGPLSLEWASLILFLSSLIGIGGLLKVFKVQGRLKTPIQTWLIFGLCFNLFAGALFAVLQFAFMALQYRFPAHIWFGNFRYVDATTCLFLVGVSFFLYIWGQRLSPELWGMSFGEEFALGLGIQVERVQRQVMLLSLLVTGVVSCLFGLFSFFGLLAPHLLRSFSFFQSRIQREILYGPLLGGFLFTFLDTLCFSFPLEGAEIPVGMLSLLMGSGFLMVVMLRKIRIKQTA